MGAPAIEVPAPARGLRALRVYADARMLAILAMGFASGLPLPLTLSTLTYWLAKVGVDRTSIGLFLLVGVPYSFKFVWAPAIDQVRIPWLTRRLGRRRSWALLSQVGLVVAILSLGGTDPASAPLITAALVVTVAFLSASQDIAIDAYRIEILGEHEQGAGAAATQLGSRIGLLVAGGGAIALSDFVPWSTVFAGLAALVTVGMIAVSFAREPAVARVQVPRDTSALRHAFFGPFIEFTRRPGWVAILAFVPLYKVGDAILGGMANPFYVALRFTGVEIASITTVLGTLATFGGIFAGGALVAQIGIHRALLVGGILQASTNLLFALQAHVGHDVGLLALAISSDNFTGGVASAAFVAYLSSLCRAEFTGTQYALLTSLMAQGRTVLSSGGGWLAEQVDWVTFFVLTTALAAPGLLLLLRIGRGGSPGRTPE